MKLFVAGVSHKTAPVEVREQLAVTPSHLVDAAEVQPAIASKSTGRQNARAATSNRFSDCSPRNRENWTITFTFTRTSMLFGTCSVSRRDWIL